VSDDDLILFGLQYRENNHVRHKVLKGKGKEWVGFIKPLELK
jgi:hypothetical protein